MSDRLKEALSRLVQSGSFAKWYNSLGPAHKDPAADKEYQDASALLSPLTSSKIQALVRISKAEGEKNLVWTPTGDAEKYLASVRSAVGMPVPQRFPWCGAFVYWCCKQAGFKFSASFPTGFTAAYVPGWEAWARNKKAWYSSRLTAKEFNAEPGDIVIFDWDSDSVADHIGIVLSYDGKRTLITAEGNTAALNDSNGNATAIRTRDWLSCKGFIRLTEND